MSKSGTVLKWISQSGYGFIDDGSEENIFVHRSNLEDGVDALNIGEKVTFDTYTDERSGREQATNVKGDGSGQPDERGGRNNYGGNNYRNNNYGNNRGGNNYRGNNNYRSNNSYGGNRSGGSSSSGKCVKWVVGRGYGFIKDDETGEDVYVHGSALEQGVDCLNIGEKCTFEVSENNGRYRAQNVQGDGSGTAPAARENRGYGNNNYGNNNNRGYGNNGGNNWNNSNY